MMDSDKSLELLQHWKKQEPAKEWPLRWNYSRSREEGISRRRKKGTREKKIKGGVINCAEYC